MNGKDGGKKLESVHNLDEQPLFLGLARGGYARRQHNNPNYHFRHVLPPIDPSIAFAIRARNRLGAPM